jgi:Tfp pilus assembly protein PilF
VAAVVTIMTQAGAGAVPEIATVPLAGRVANAAVGYLRYIGKLLYPANLAIFYPLAKIPTVVGAAGLTVIVAATIIAFRARIRRPYVLVGWLWFLVTLLPVIGLVQVGGQALADRYTYIPSIGLLIAVAWTAGDGARFSPFVRGALAVSGVATVVACALLSYRALPYWKDSVSVFERAIATTENNFLAHNNLGEALMQLGRVQEAGAHYARAVEIHPGYPEARNNYGVFLAEQGRYAEAEEQFRAALAIRPELAGAESNVATIRLRLGDLEGAVAHYERALTIDPANPDAHFSYGDALTLLGRPQEAILHYEAALRLRPGWPAAQSGLQRARSAIGGAIQSR